MIYHGDCIDVLKGMPENSVDSVVTDPPYGWRFMGKAWDVFDIEKKAKQARRPGEFYIGQDGKRRQTRDDNAMAAGKYDLTIQGNLAFQAWTTDWAREAYRVLKPGGHMLVFCGPRTYHRMASGVEDAGFEVRDQLQWIFGSGFPKSLSLKNIYRPELGTALKPANEPILLARKPLSEKTVAANVLKWGCGGLNIDSSRIAAHDAPEGRLRHGGGRPQIYGKYNQSIKPAQPEGRFPSNLLLDEVAAEMLDAQSGVSKSTGGHTANFSKEIYGKYNPKIRANSGGLGDVGGASRFFYCAKASRRERNEGCDGLEAKYNDFQRESCGLSQGKNPVTGERSGKRISPSNNHHPTCKPLRLMSYLIRLVTPPNGICLDPFLGSGTTGVAALREGFQFIGIEKEAEYIAIAEKRIGEASDRAQDLTSA